MESSYDKINDFLVSIFNNILDVQERSLQNKGHSDLSISEIHTINAIGVGEVLTSSEISKKLGITLGTLTIAANKLVNKGYVSRHRSTKDRRVVTLQLTQAGVEVYHIHKDFHRDMIQDSLKSLTANQTKALMIGLEKLAKYIENKGNCERPMKYAGPHKK